MKEDLFRLVTSEAVPERTIFVLSSVSASETLSLVEQLAEILHWVKMHPKYAGVIRSVGKEPK